jgi:hypothetical protein
MAAPGGYDLSQLFTTGDGNVQIDTHPTDGPTDDPTAGPTAGPRAGAAASG